MSELLKTLMIAEALAESDQSAAELCALVGVSVATVKRYLSDLRHMGCVIESVRGAGGWLYRLGNGSAVERRLRVWLVLERERRLLADGAATGQAD